MADEKQLQDNQAQVANIIAQLQAQAGPRGATYAGRVITPQDTPQSIMARLPAGDTEEYGSMGLLAPGLGGVGAGITKAELKAGVRPPVQIATIARKGEIPTVAPHEMWPAGINVETGEVAHAYKAGIGGHKPFEAMKGAVRGFVDPNTWKAYTQEMLEALGNYWERAGGFFRAR